MTCCNISLAYFVRQNEDVLQQTVYRITYFQVGMTRLRVTQEDTMAAPPPTTVHILDHVPSDSNRRATKHFDQFHRYLTLT